MLRSDSSAVTAWWIKLLLILSYFEWLFQNKRKSEWWSHNIQLYLFICRHQFYILLICLHPGSTESFGCHGHTGVVGPSLLVRFTHILVMFVSWIDAQVCRPHANISTAIPAMDYPLFVRFLMQQKFVILTFISKRFLKNPREKTGPLIACGAQDTHPVCSMVCTALACICCI